MISDSWHLFLQADAGLIMPGSRKNLEMIPVPHNLQPRASRPPLPRHLLLGASPPRRTFPPRDSAIPPAEPLLLTSRSDAEGANLRFQGGGGVGYWRGMDGGAQPRAGRTGGIGRNREEPAGFPGNTWAGLDGAGIVNPGKILAGSYAEQSAGDGGGMSHGLRKRPRSVVEWWADNPLADEREEGEICEGELDYGRLVLTAAAAKAEQSLFQTRVGRFVNEVARKDASDTLAA